MNNAITTTVSTTEINGLTISLTNSGSVYFENSENKFDLSAREIKEELNSYHQVSSLKLACMLTGITGKRALLEKVGYDFTHLKSL